MSTNNTFIKSISFILVFTIILSSVFTGGFSASAETVGDTSAPDTSVVEKPYVIGEDIGLRKANEKHFLMSDGTRVAAMYDTDVHYLDENGEYQEIDNSFESAENDEYQTKKGKNEVKLAKKASAKKLVTLHTDEYKISWGFEGAKKVKAQVIEDNNKTDEDFAIKNINGEMKYVDAFENVDLEYIVKPNGIKENIILKSADAQNEFVINYDVGKLVAVQKDSRTIELLEGETVKYTISAPVMIDANNKISTDLSLTLTEQKNGKLTALLSADSAWLSDSEIAYPVIIDPYLIDATTPSNLVACTSYDSPILPSSGFDFSQCTYVGYDTRTGTMASLYRYSTLPELPETAYITNAQFCVAGNTSNENEIETRLYEISEVWSPTTNYAMYYAPEHDDCIISACTSNGVFTYDITILAKKWYYYGLGDSGNYGFKIVSDSIVYAMLGSPRYSNANSRPSLMVYYIDQNGVEDHYSYTNFDIGSGLALVNNATGGLTVELPIAATISENMPVAFSLYYNSNQSNGSGYINCGNGWRSNFDQRIFPVNDQRLTANGFDYTYTDGDGTIHYIKENDDGVYQDETGLGYTLTISGSQKILESKDGSKCYFDSSGKLIKIQSPITSSVITLTYSGNYVTKITDGVGNTLTFNRTNNRLLSITDNYNRSITFSYTGNNLTRIDNYDNTFVTMTYGSYNELLSFIATDGIKTVFEYEYFTSERFSKKVKQVNYQAMADSTGARAQGDEYTFGYSVNSYTTVTYPGGTETTYVFDQYGRAESVFNENGAASATYTQHSSSNSINNNKITQTTSNDQPVENLLLNNSFESGDNWWTWVEDSNSTATLQTTHRRLGQKGLKLQCNSADSATTYFQVYFPKKSGYYTYSAYYKIDSPLLGDGARVMMALVDRYGTKTYSASQQVNQDSKGTWLRLSVTAYVDVNTIHQIHLVNALQYSTGTVYFDCAQLEYGETPSDYNMLTNAFFNNGITGWSNADSYYINYGIDSNDPGNKPDEFENAYYLERPLENDAYIEQTVPIYLVGANAVLNLSAYGYAMPTEPNKGLELSIIFNYEDGAKETQVVKLFNPYNRSWQRYGGMVVPKKKTTQINTATVKIKYTDMENFGYVTGVQLGFDVSGRSYTYDSNGNVITATDASNMGIDTEYDDNNRLTQKTMRDKVTYAYEYEGDSRLVKSATGPDFAYEGDYSDNLNQKLSYEYNAYGQQTKVTQSNATLAGKSIVSSAQYSSNGQHLLSTTNEIGTTTTNTYDAFDRLHSINYGGKSTTGYTYDNSNRITQTTESSNNENKSVSVSYGYTNQSLTSILHNGFSYNFAYNTFGSPTTISVAGRTLITNTYGINDYNISNSPYNRANVLTKSTYGNGDKITYDYDKYGRVVEESHDGEVKYQYKYTANGSLYMMRDLENNKKYFYFYDSLGRLNDVQTSDGSRIFVTYNENNNVNAKQYTYAGETKQYTYRDYRGGLPHYSIIDGDIHNYIFYDTLSRVSESKIYLHVDYQYWSTQYEYCTVNRNESAPETATNLVNRVTHSSVDNNEYTPKIDLQYSYDSFGNITQVTDSLHPTANPTTYEYDYLNQLTRENNGQTGKTTVYNYDNGGNILSKTVYDYTTGSLDGLTGNVVQYTYNDTGWKDLLTAYNGNAITYDEIGNPLNYYNGTTFQWASGRRLTHATKADGTYMSYRYNASGIRTRKSVNGVATEYFLDGNVIVAQKTGNNTIWFYYNSAGQRIGFEYNGADYFYIYNLQGDVIGLTNGYSIIANYTYDSWGKLISITDGNGNAITDSTHAAIANPFRYRGYYYDTETGLYYVSSRYYDPEIGRWINADSQLNTNSLLGYNLFAYCENNPVNKVDSTGHMAAEATLAATNWWNPVGWIAAAVLVVEVVVLVVAVCYTIDETATAVENMVEAIDNIVNTKDQSVYLLTDTNDKVRYVGRTNDPARREYEHKHDSKHPERQDYKMTVVATGLNIPQAKTTEQILISAYTLAYLDNARREIAVGNLSQYNDNISAVIQIFGSVTEDELKNLMGR